CRIVIFLGCPALTKLVPNSRRTGDASMRFVDGSRMVRGWFEDGLKNAFGHCFLGAAPGMRSWSSISRLKA
ncbi:MAG: hypothetical protein AAGI88_21510, partial [Pseudomonadota bacterium]